MIEKIDIPQSTAIDASLLWGGINDKVLAAKINEVIDAVNELQKHEEQHLDLLTQLNEMRLHQKKEPTDPYAEQRKWIGKACWFWDSGAKTRAFGELNQVDTEYNDAPFQTNFGQWYEHCEPVSPDDDIIYKGGDNEL